MLAENLGSSSEIIKKPLYKSFVNSRYARPVLALAVLFSTVGGAVTSTGVFAKDGQGIDKPIAEPTLCAQKITRAKNRVTNEIRCFPDTCFSREVWEELPSAAGCDEPTIYKIFVPSVNNNYLQPDDDYPRVGPRPLPYP